MKSKVALWVLIAVAVTLVILTIAAGIASRSEPLRQLVVATLEDRLNSNVELKTFSVDTRPTVAIQGEELILRLRGAGNVPPLIKIKRFTVYCGILDLIHRPRRFKRVVLEGLEINIPPGGLRQDRNTIAEAIESDADGDGKSDAKSAISPIIVDELQADGAVLRIIPRREGKVPKEFAIHTL